MYLITLINLLLTIGSATQAVINSVSFQNQWPVTRQCRESTTAKNTTRNVVVFKWEKLRKLSFLGI